MAILNVTPDSFADGGQRLDPGVAIADAERMLAEGADLIDIGGESTRPGAPPLDEREEWRRIEPVIRGLRARALACRSPSTPTRRRSPSARSASASIIVNDISALTYDPAIGGVVARDGRRRDPDAQPRAIGRHVRARRVRRRRRRGCGRAVRRETPLRAKRASRPTGSFWIPDSVSRNARRIPSRCSPTLPRFAALGRPILVGPSRKSFLTAAIGERAAR